MQLSEIVRKVRQLEIRTNREIDEVTSGAYKSMFQGRGIEFDEVREYSESDDARDIDWNVTARMNHPFVKKYIEERELNVMLLMDVSASNWFGRGGSGKHECALEAAAMLAMSAIRNQDKAGLMLFSSERELYLPPGNSTKHALQIIRQAMAFEPRNRGTDLSRALKEINNLLNQRSVIFVISDLIDGQDFSTALKILNKKHDVIVLHIIDEVEQVLPGRFSIEIVDSESGENVSYDGADALEFQQQAARLLTERSQKCRKCGVDVIDLYTGQSPLLPMVEFFRKRKRARRNKNQQNSKGGL